MFSFLRSEAGKLRAEARELLRIETKVLRHRRDVIAPGAQEEIAIASTELRAAVADKAAETVRIKDGIAKLDALLRREGGKIHPVGAIADWTETFVIAAVLAGGVRAFIFQPFKIPTNSMYPTYHGMTAKDYADNEPDPGLAQKAWRKIVLGANHMTPVAPVSGEVLIPLYGTVDAAVPAPPEKNKAQDDGLLGTGLLKGPADVHTLYVGETPVPIVTPTDFAIDGALLAAFFPAEAALPVTTQEKWTAVIEGARERGDLRVVGNHAVLRTRKTVEAGRPLMRFDILTGDMVFVDRMSYHFVRPKVGDAFVFRTSLVPGLRNDGDFFYIKRLVGAPGDTLRVKDGVLLRDGTPASGNLGFDNNNAHRADLEYFGYLPAASAAYPLVEERKVPEHHYWAMGDNSANSRDSRYFGPVPEEALVGRGIFVVHPFTDRWGRAR